MKPNVQRRAAGRGGRGGGGGAGGRKHKDKLHKFMVSVQKLVQGEGGHDEPEHDKPARKGPVVRRKSRKDLRREQRKLKKKKKIKLQPQASSSSSDQNLPKKSKQTVGADLQKSALKPKAQPKQDKPELTQLKKPAKKVHFEKTSSEHGTKAKVAMVRKKALIEANQVEDREIKKLEKRLGLHKRRNKQKLPQSFVDDGLDYILGFLEPGGSGLYESDDDVDAAKAKSQLEKLEESSEDEESQDDEDGDPGSDRKDAEEDDGEEDEGVEGEDMDQDDEDMDQDDEDEEMDEEDDNEDEEMDKGEDAEEEEGEDDDEDLGDKEENEEDLEDSEEDSQDEPSSEATTSKYLPPQLREAADSKRRAELERLKRNLKGLINRLSEANMASISGQVEELYMSCSRKDMNEALTELLMAACVTPALMPDRLLMEHMLLVSVLHHTVGLEVGAHFLETVVRRLDELQRPGESEDKQCANLASMLAHLYNFQVVHCLLLSDVLRRLLATFTAQDVELVLLLLRNVGFSLRKDDPLGLRELIGEAQRKANDAGSRFSDQTRVRFMLETMLALKNNDMRKIPGYDPEPVERLRKLQRSLIQNRAGGTDVKLRVSLENLLEAQTVGRWWIVGSSWSGVPMISADKPTAPPVSGEQFSAKVLELARKQRMNTDVRRNIFCVIMTSEDYLDAFEKLLRLGLKGQQERDIVHVLLDCCLQEKTFNGFYTVLAEKFCVHDRRFQMTFQFSLWDKFKDLATLSSSSFSNLVQMVTQLLHKNALSLSILKAIEFGELDKPRVKFLRQILSKLLQQTQPEDLVQIFGRISGIPKLGMLREGLKLFIRHFLLRSAQTEGALLTERAEIAIRAMEAHDAKLKL
ncbi:nucleolar MIF4G domain-containing protein 1 [Trichomycterus rosablanca]|uniref:nucleolar MIF4G domain-containing protein 1 n=1 Tax=Trichomycterus rosablanca TaxID=2290929 RepID=UPI002F3564DD